MIILLVVAVLALFAVAVVAGIRTGIKQGKGYSSSRCAGRKDEKPDDTVYVYPNGKVYHKSMFCSDSASIPKPMSEKIAQIQGLHRCTKCWK